MSSGTDVQDKEEQELEAMKEQINQLAEAEKAKAEGSGPPHPAPEVSTPAEAPTPESGSVTQTSEVQETPKTKDDPMEWAKKKGFKTPEDMARALLQKEQEFHASRQKAEVPQAPTPPSWQPQPQMYPQAPAYQPYPQMPQAQFRPDMVRQVAAMYPQLAPEDTERILPVIFDVARVVSKQERDAYEKELVEIRRNTDRNNELMQLMQDPAFRDERVQREIHAIVDSNPAIFQMGKGAYTHLFKEALGNMARKQLQQRNGEEESSNRPPTTAAGGNGSAFTVPRPVTEKEFDSWSSEDQRAYINSKGRILPKNRR